MNWENGDAPEGWTLRLLGEVTKVVGGGTPKTAIKENFSHSEGHPWITPADLSGFDDKFVRKGRRYLTDRGLATSSAKLLPAGTVLFSSRAPIGYVAIAENPVATNQGFRSFLLSDELHPEYLYYALKYLRPLAEQMASGTTFSEISGSSAAQLPIAYPDRRTQAAIVEVLDISFSKRRSALIHLEATRHAAERFRQSVLAAACSGRLTADWRDEHTDNSISPNVSENKEALPPGWTWSTIGGLVKVATGATPLRKRADYYHGTIPWVTSGSVNAGLITEADEYITELAIKETNAKLFPAGTLLVAMYGEGQTRGRVAELGISAATNQAVAALLFDERSETLRSYLRVFLLENYERVRRLSFGGVQPNLSLGVIKDMSLPLPPEDEQIEIVHRVERLLAVADALRARIAAAGRRVDRTSQAILAKAFRGELSHSLIDR